MKKIMVIVFMISALCTQAQKASSGLLFCTGVSDEFKPMNTTTELTLQNGKGTIVYYYWSDNPVNADSIIYKTFLVDKAGKETLTGTIKQNVQPAWRMIKQNASYTFAGTYRVKIYNTSGEELTAATLTVK